MTVDPFKRSLFLNIGFLFLSFVAATVALFFLSSRITSEVEAILASRRAEVQYSADANALVRLKSEKPQADVLTPVLDSLLPREDRLYDFSPWLNQRGIAHQLTLDFKFGESQSNAAPPQPSSIPFRLIAIGSKEDIISFVQDIESQSQGGYLVGIDTIDLVKTTEGYRAAMPGELFFVKKQQKSTQ